MAYRTYETILRLAQRSMRDQLASLPPDQRSAFQQQFEQRFAELLENAANGNSDTQFADLVGLGSRGILPFDDVSYPHITPDFDESVMPSQLHAAAELYYIYQHERMRVFEVVDVLRKLFQAGRLRIQRGPGARGLYLLEKWEPLRYSIKDRLIAYRRVFNYGKGPIPAGAVVNKNFHFQLVAFMSALAQYFRDLTVSDVIRGSNTLDQRPFGSIATLQRLGTDLRYALDRASYGNILALTQEVGHYLMTVLDLVDSPDLRRAFDASNKWDVIESATNRHLGGAKELSQRSKMAESGRRILQWIADNDFDTTVDPDVFRVEAQAMAAHAEAWIAAYRLTSDGRRFPGVDQNLRWALGVPDSKLKSIVS